MGSTVQTGGAGAFFQSLDRLFPLKYACLMRVGWVLFLGCQFQLANSSQLHMAWLLQIQLV